MNNRITFGFFGCENAENTSVFLAFRKNKLRLNEKLVKSIGGKNV